MGDQPWITATSTFNYMLKDPLLDWLNLYAGGSVHGTTRTTGGVKRKFDEIATDETSFTQCIMKQGEMFEAKVVDHLKTVFGQELESVPVSGTRWSRTRRTTDAMNRGVLVIHGGMLANTNNNTYGVPDLLVRSDAFVSLVSDSPLTFAESHIRAPKLKGATNYHYRIVDIKFTALSLCADGQHILNSGAFPAYKAQLLIYTLALGQTQGYVPSKAYILGRRWHYRTRGEKSLGNYSLDRLGVIDYNGRDYEFREKTRDAIEWVRMVRQDDAKHWRIEGYPLDLWQLYPNMCNTYDHPWRGIKEEIAQRNKELTNLWMVGPKNREMALSKGISSYANPKCNAKRLGISSQKYANCLDQMLYINQPSNNKTIILPKTITNNFCGWQRPAPHEFFVDFETFVEALGPVHLLAETQGNPIFMIGIGHMTDNGWVQKTLVSDVFSASQASALCLKMTTYIQGLCGGRPAKLFHWSNAEPSLWRQYSPQTPTNWDWVDLLKVFKDEPIVIRGCMSFSLKDVASSLCALGQISQKWAEPMTGIDVLVLAKTAIKQNIPLSQTSEMKRIAAYNDVDVAVLYDILQFLRSKTERRQKN